VRGELAPYLPIAYYWRSLRSLHWLRSSAVAGCAFRIHHLLAAQLLAFGACCRLRDRQAQREENRYRRRSGGPASPGTEHLARFCIHEIYPHRLICA
jgi:hypothetical protein